MEYIIMAVVVGFLGYIAWKAKSKKSKPSEGTGTGVGGGGSKDGGSHAQQ
jgi:hypothetical protein